MKVGYLTEDNPSDITKWSGLISNIHGAIKLTNVEIIQIPIRHKTLIRYILGGIYQLLKLFYNNIDIYHTRISGILYGIMIDKKKCHEVDVIISPSGSVLLSYLKCNKPIILICDGTFKLLSSYYSSFSNLPNWNLNEGNRIEKKALEHSSMILPASDWAKQSIMLHYGISEEKILVAEFGANLKNVSFISHDAPNFNLHILFIGVDWERKGGKIACETCILLNSWGIKAKLSIVGLTSIPSIYMNREEIDLIGFLNKSNKVDSERLSQLLKNSHIFLLPTKAECAGIVFSEASAYGLPIFTFDTGGIANYVQNGVNGYRLSLNSQPLDFASKIREMIVNDMYFQLSNNGRKLYEEHLNWNSWAEKLNIALKKIERNG